MNRLAFDPKKQMVDEWQQIYFCEEIVNSFQTIIDKTHMYLQVITNHRARQDKDKRKLKSKRSLCSNTEEIDVEAIRSEIKYFEKDDPHTTIQRIQQWIKTIRVLTVQAHDQHEANLNNQEAGQDPNDPTHILGINMGKVLSVFKFKLCQMHLQSIGLSGFKYYNAVLHQQFRIMEDFLCLKFDQLQTKYQKLKIYFGRFEESDEHCQKLRIIFQNLYIQADYLRVFIYKNLQIFQHNSHEKQYSSGYQEINDIRQNFIEKLNNYTEKIQNFKENIRVMYYAHIRKSKKRIRNHQKLQNKIRSQIAVNSHEYKKSSTSKSFFNGFTCAFLLCILVAIIIFRQVNINALESDPNYLSDFKVWRGASFLIYYNWIFGIVFWFFNKFRINYRLILLEDDMCIPSYQTFFFSASLLSAVYLVLFFVYLLHQLKIIMGYDNIRYMGFYMWIINLVFLLNPFKILNYEGRRYFITVLYKAICTLFRPMNMNIFFLSIIIGSFVQPFSDFAFTVCRAASLQKNDCVQDTKIATFVFTVTYLSYRFVQSIRSHIQFGDRCYSRPLIGITAVSFGMNTVISSFLYNTYLTNELKTYWIVSAIFSTIAGIQADLRADWGLISFDKEDCILRKYKMFPRATYFIVSAIDIVLNIGWVLTLSNSTADDIGLNPVYFLMILAYVELARKGMWMFFRIEDDHSLNIATLAAVLDDSHIYKAFDQHIHNPNTKSLSFQLIVWDKSQQQAEQKYIDEDPQFGNNSLQPNGTTRYQDVLNSNEKNDRSSQRFDPRQQVEKKEPPTLEKIQLMVVNKKIIRNELKKLIGQLEEYLETVHMIYSNLDWEDA